MIVKGVWIINILFIGILPLIVSILVNIGRMYRKINQDIYENKITVYENELTNHLHADQGIVQFSGKLLDLLERFGLHPKKSKNVWYTLFTLALFYPVALQVISWLLGADITFGAYRLLYNIDIWKRFIILFSQIILVDFLIFKGIDFIFDNKFLEKIISNRLDMKRKNTIKFLLTIFLLILLNLLIFAFGIIMGSIITFEGSAVLIFIAFIVFNIVSLIRKTKKHGNIITEKDTDNIDIIYISIAFIVGSIVFTQLKIESILLTYIISIFSIILFIPLFSFFSWIKKAYTKKNMFFVFLIMILIFDILIIFIFRQTLSGSFITIIFIIIIIPFINSIIDFFSIYMSTIFLNKVLRYSSNKRKYMIYIENLFNLLLTIIASAILIYILVFLISFFGYIYNYYILQGAYYITPSGDKLYNNYIDYVILFNDMITSPFDINNIWVTIMIITPIVPIFICLIEFILYIFHSIKFNSRAKESLSLLKKIKNKKTIDISYEASIISKNIIITRLFSNKVLNSMIAIAIVIGLLYFVVPPFFSKAISDIVIFAKQLAENMIS